jgi:hypothetical protein
VIAKRLHSDCAPIAKRLLSNCAAIAHRLRSYCSAIAQRLLSDCEATAKRLRTDCEATAHRLRSDCEATAHRLRSDCAAIAQRLRSDCAAIAKQLHSDCAAIALRFQGECEVKTRLLSNHKMLLKRLQDDYLAIASDYNAIPISISYFLYRAPPQFKNQNSRYNIKYLSNFQVVGLSYGALSVIILTIRALLTGGKVGDGEMALPVPSVQASVPESAVKPKSQ